MSHYAYELNESTTYIKKIKYDEILTKIKKEVEKPEWNCFGWRNSVLNAETFEDVMYEFNIQLIDVNDDLARPVIEDVYVSAFFGTLLEIVAPFMTDGTMTIDDEYDQFEIIFKNGKMKKKLIKR